MACSVGHVELEEEVAAVFCVVRVQFFEWVMSTSGNFVFPTLSEGELRQCEEGCDKAARVT